MSDFQTAAPGRPHDLRDPAHLQHRAGDRHRAHLLRPPQRGPRQAPRGPADRLRGRGHVLPVVLQDLAVQLRLPPRAMSRTTARIVFGVTAAFFAVFFLVADPADPEGRLHRRGRAPDVRLPGDAPDGPDLPGRRCATPSCSPAPGPPLALADRAAAGRRSPTASSFPCKGFLNSAVLVPMILPPFVGAIGIKQIFGQYGAAQRPDHRPRAAAARLDVRLVRREPVLGRSRSSRRSPSTPSST